jgi:hypothetical protein
MNSIRPTTSFARPRTRFAKGLVFLACVAASGVSFAGPGFYCLGNVIELGLDLGGNVNIRLAGDNDVHAICNTETQMSSGMPTSTCKAAYAALLANRMAQTPMRVYYYSNATTTSCTTFPSWGIMPAYFVEVPSP